MNLDYRNTYIIMSDLDGDATDRLKVVPEAIFLHGKGYVPFRRLQDLRKAFRGYKGSVQKTSDFEQKVNEEKGEPQQKIRQNAKLIVYPGRTIVISNNIPHESIEKVTTFFYKPAVHSKLYKEMDEKGRRRWDGNIKLYKRRTRSFPTGLLPDVMKALREDYDFTLEYRFVRRPPKQFVLKLVDWLVPTEDQEIAMAIACNEGRGVIKCPTGFGKTAVLSAGLICELGVPTLFVANQKTLIRDAAEDFIEHIDGISSEDVGWITEGEKHIRTSNKIVVATIQSLSKFIEKRDQEVIDLLKHQIKMVIVDECQFYGTSIWNNVFYNVWAPYRFFISATPERTDGATMMITGASGPVIYETFAKKQIEQGHLAEVDIVFYAFNHGIYNQKDKGLEYTPDYYKEFIVHNQERNELLIQKAIEMLEEGRHILLLVQMIEHGEIVRDMLLERGITDVEFLHGSVNTKKRHQLKNSFKHGEYRVLIGSSIFNVGINLPIVSGIVNFAAGNAQNTEIQKIGRALRKYSGEKGNYVDPERGMKVSKIIEVLDKNIAFFEAQAWNRYRTCKSEFGKERVRIIGQVDSENSKRRAKKTVEASSVQEQIDLALEWFKNLDIKE